MAAGCTQRLRRAVSLVAFAGLIALGNTAVHAQAQRAIVNPSFEANDPGGPGTPTWAPFANGEVPGWTTTDTGIELWDTNYLSVPAADGSVFAEMNYTKNSSLYQSVCLINGETFNWRFAHRARADAAATQTARFEIANTSGTVLQTIYTSATSSTTAWAYRAGSNTIYTGGSGIRLIQFTTPDTGSTGNFLDDIQIELKPFVEFSPAATTSAEGVTSPTIPGLLISGTFFTTATVTVNITGGTATRGTDYTTPGGGSSFAVTIPAGTYNAQTIPLGITITNDNIVESPETITFSIAANNAVYLRQSTSSCGVGGITTATHTITDDAIVATDDAVTGVNGNAGAANVINALANDRLEASAPTVSNTTITVTSPATPISGGQVPVLDTATGWVNVPAGTRSGTYTIGYRICEKLQPTNCATANISITVMPSVDLQIAKTDGKTQVFSGDTVTYTVTVTNAGPDPVTGAVVKDTPGAGLTCTGTNPVAITGSGVPSGSFTIANLTSSGITLATLNNGQSAVLTYSCKVN